VKELRESMIKLVSDTIDREDINHLIQWLSQDKIPRLTKGELTWALEEKWAQKIGTKHSVFVNSGSSAILLTLAALKQSGELPNNKIVVPALSWATDVSSPMLLDYEVLLCDCNLDDLSCDITYLEMLFKSHNPSALILVSPLGLVPEMDKITSLCEEYGVLLLEDVCESMGSKHQNQYLGSFGHASFFSLYFGHHLSTIEGGFINTNDEDLYHLLLMMRSHGWDRDLPPDKQKEIRRKYQCTDFSALYNFYVPGFNLRSTDLQAFIGLRVIDKLDNYSQARHDNFNEYIRQIKGNKIHLKERPGDFVSSFSVPVLHNKRNTIVEHLDREGVEVRPLIAGNMAAKPMWLDTNDQPFLPNCELIDSDGFYIPNHQDLSVDNITSICKIINKYEA